MKTLQQECHEAYYAAVRADEAYSAACLAQYGSHDRYRVHTEAPVVKARDAKYAADEAYRVACKALRAAKL